MRRLTKDEANELLPRWALDGKLIVFYSNRDKQEGLWVVSSDGGEPRLDLYIYQTNSTLRTQVKASLGHLSVKGWHFSLRP